MQRWAKVGKEPFRLHVFGAQFHDEDTFGGYTLPTRTTAGYGFGTDRWPEGAFVQQVIDDATFH